ncbi:MAG: glycosyltransferase family 4 protein [Phycisphaeraceae bacterium]|nr:glycosyltransferase family 4 protein [Phycisphaeraceae bacterium]
MRMLFINQFYWPDMAATSQMLSDLAQRLAARGHEVHILCSRGKYDDGTANARSPRYEVHHGVHIHRVAAAGFGKASMIGRMIDYLSFHLLIGMRTLLAGWRYDIIVTLTTPPLIGVYATLAKHLFRVRHVCWVMDLHPDCEFELGVFSRKSLLPRVLDHLNGMHFRHADRNVVLGSCMKHRLLDKHVREDKLATIPVWGHDLVTEDSTALREQLGLTGKFVVMYSGNAGLAHTFDAVCEAALRMRDETRFVFLFVGGGKRMDDVRRFAEQHKLTNVVMKSYFPRENLGQSLTMADAHLITLRPAMAGVAVPCKLYGIMAAARPVLFVGPRNCETAQAITRWNCGKVIDPDDATSLVAAIRQLADDASLGQRQAAAARQAYEQQYNAEACAAMWSRLLEELSPTGRTTHSQPCS